MQLIEVNLVYFIQYLPGNTGLFWLAKLRAEARYSTFSLSILNSEFLKQFSSSHWSTLVKFKIFVLAKPYEIFGVKMLTVLEPFCPLNSR